MFHHRNHWNVCASTKPTFLFTAKKKIILISPCLSPLAVDTLRSACFSQLFVCGRLFYSHTVFSFLDQIPLPSPHPPNKSSLQMFALSHLTVKFQICKNEEHEINRKSP